MNRTTTQAAATKRLANRVVVTTILLIASCTIAVLGLLIANERRYVQLQLQGHGQSLGASAAAFCIEPMLIEDYPVLSTYIKKLTIQDGFVSGMRVRLPDGRVVVSSSSVISQSPEVGIHQIVVPIFVPGTKESIGSVELDLSTALYKRQMRERITLYAGASIVGLVIIGFATAFLIKGLIVTPIKRIEKVATSIAGGDREQTIKINRNDELGSLALAVDDMRVQLNRQIEQLSGEVVTRARAEAVAHTAQQLAEQANKAKDQFLANMSHEIRTPLTGILGYVDLLSKRDPDPQQRKTWTDRIRISGNHLLSIVDDILDISRIEQQKVPINQGHTDVKGLINDVIGGFHNIAGAKNIDLEVRYEGFIPNKVESDPVRLKQILLNLVGNAIKFTEQGMVQITVAYRDQSAAETKELMVSVQDSGPGIPADKCQSIFNPFEQVDPSSTREYGGTGLGLAIARGLANALGGTLELESTLGIGSTFYLKIPIKECANPINQEPIPSVQESTSSSAEDLNISKDTHVLIVDDCEDNVALLELYLSEIGVRVKAVNNGAEGVSAILHSTHESDPFQCILLDMQMPGMDGYETARRIRDQGYSGSIIAITADAMPGTEKRCYAAGCDDYMTKPINYDLLKEMISMIHECG